MIAMLQFATLFITTMFAAARRGSHSIGCSYARHFLMMRPATARRISSEDRTGCAGQLNWPGLPRFATLKSRAITSAGPFA